MSLRTEIGRFICLCRRIAGGFILLTCMVTTAYSGEAFGLITTREPHRVEYYKQSDIPKKMRRTVVKAPDGYRSGTVVVDTDNRQLYYIVDQNRAIRYGIAVGREGKTWRGRAVIGKKTPWPTWTPTPGMTTNSSMVTITFDGGAGNPLGARALYLYVSGKDTAYRVHGSADLRTIGQPVSYGCIRMLDQDVIDLYQRVPVGAEVVVLGSSGKKLGS